MRACEIRDWQGELLESRHVRHAFKAMPVKTDRKDARGVAQLMQLGWFRPVHCKSLPAQETRALLAARKLPEIRREASPIGSADVNSGNHSSDRPIRSA